MTDVVDAIRQNTYMMILFVFVIGFILTLMIWVLRTRRDDDEEKRKMKRPRGVLTQRRKRDYYNNPPEMIESESEPMLKRKTFIQKRGKWSIFFDIDEQKLVYIKDKTGEKTYKEPDEIKVKV